MTREQCIINAVICVFKKRDDFSDSTLMDILSFLTDVWRDEQERKYENLIDTGGEVIPTAPLKQRGDFNGD